MPRTLHFKPEQQPYPPSEQGWCAPAQPNWALFNWNNTKIKTKNRQILIEEESIY